jgi:hypothetical protein
MVLLDRINISPCNPGSYLQRRDQWLSSKEKWQKSEIKGKKSPFSAQTTLEYGDDNLSQRASTLRTADLPRVMLEWLKQSLVSIGQCTQDMNSRATRARNRAVSCF